MGKYKNDCAVTGPDSLLNAFAKELTNLGYTRKETAAQNVKEGLTFYGYNGSKEHPSTFVKYRYVEPGLLKKDAYQLPEQWHEALAAASELCEEFPFKIGDWVIDSKGKSSFQRIIDINEEGFKVEWFERKDNHRVEWSYKRHFSYLFKKADFRQVTDHLISLVKNLGYNDYDRFTALRDTDKSIDLSAGSNYPALHAIWGNDYSYNPELDVLYCLGYGRYVIYEKGQFIKSKEKLPRLHNYNGKVVGNNIHYGCQYASIRSIKDLVSHLNHFNSNGKNTVKITQVSFNGNLVPIEDLNKINDIV